MEINNCTKKNKKLAYGILIMILKTRINIVIIKLSDKYNIKLAI